MQENNNIPVWFAAINIGALLITIFSLLGAFIAPASTGITFMIVSTIGLIFMIAGSIWLIINAGRIHLGWAAACFFLPPAQFIFTFMHFRQAAKPMALSFVGLFLIIFSTLASFAMFPVLMGTI
ncbi:MAG TPA: hypothetical protein VLL52_04985 [Anaerolineae bacterium]|nr:hypothetical protein [Anaerolineae bacterium]